MGKLTFCCYLAITIASFPAFSQDNSLPVEIVISGKQPGPPMWRVKNGENTLWIFALLSPIPKDMLWESLKVESVIADSQEYIPYPDVDVSIPKLVMFNPINIFRGIRLGTRMSRNENKASLEEVLPEHLYTRYSMLKTQYFPRNRKIEKYRPLVAGAKMVKQIQEYVGLSEADDLRKQIDRLSRRNKEIKITQVKYEIELDGGFKGIASRVETLMGSISHELELSCFEAQLTQMEEDLNEMKYRANAWAQGYIEEFKFIPLTGDDNDDCTNLLRFSSEQDAYTDITKEIETLWLDAAENALLNNTTTFAVLDISQLLLEGGLLAQLKSRGYDLIEP